MRTKKLTSLLLVLALIAALGALGTAQGVPQLSVWTDQPQYTVGETIRIFYFTNTNCMGSLIVYKPDGSAVTVVNNWVSANIINRYEGQVGYPLGQRTVIFQCQGATAQAQYSVVSGPSGGVSGQICIQFPFGVICIGGSGQPSPGPGPGPGPGGQLPSLPPFPGIDPGDFGQGQGQQQLLSILAIQPTISPSGSRTARFGSGFTVTVSGIDAANFTTVMLAEWQPTGFWSLYNYSGWHPSSRLAVNWVGNLRGIFYIIAWVDNNHNWLVDPGELTIPWLTVQVW